MTYDLTLRPRSGELDRDALVAYLEDNGWAIDDDTAQYENDVTGVYFELYLGDAELVFSVSYFRCTPFALEADLEIAALVEQLDLAVEDPQENGIEGDRYSDEQFLRGWAHGNAFAYRTALADIESTPLTYDGDVLEDIWRWNYNLELTAEDNGGHYQAPPIGFVEHEGVAHSIFAYAVGENMLVPRTDLVAIVDGERMTIVPWRMLEDALALAGDATSDDPLDYWATLATTARDQVAALLKEPTLDVTQLPLEHVHALEDVEAAA